MQDSDEHADHKIKQVKASNQMIYQINALIIRQLRVPTPKAALNNTAGISDTISWGSDL